MGSKLVSQRWPWPFLPLSCLRLCLPSFACPSSFFESRTSSIGRQGFDAEKCISTPQNLAWKTSHRRDAHSKMSSNHESHLHSFPIKRYLNYTCTVHSMFPQDQSIAAVSSLVVCGFHVIPKTCSTSRTDSGSHNDIQVGRCSR